MLNVADVIAIGSRAMGGKRLTAQERRDIQTVYERETGNKLCSTCPDKYYDAIIVLRVQQKKQSNLNQNSMSQSRFKLKKNRVIKRHDSQPLTNGNLTDAAAFALLSKSKNYKEAFEKMPDNWEEELAEFKLKLGNVNVEVKITRDDDNAGGSSSNDDDNGGAKDNTAEEKVKELNKKDFDALVALAESMPEKCPKEEWQNKNRKKLIAYLKDKI